MRESVAQQPSLPIWGDKIVWVTSVNSQCASSPHWYGKQSVIFTKKSIVWNYAMQFLLHSYNFKKTGHLSNYPSSTSKRTGFGFVLFWVFPCGFGLGFFLFGLWVWCCFVFKQLNSKFCKQLFVQTSQCSSGLHTWIKVSKESNCRLRVLVEQDFPVKELPASPLQTVCFVTQHFRSCKNSPQHWTLQHS